MKSTLLLIIGVILFLVAWMVIGEFVPQPWGKLYAASTIYMVILIGVFIHMRKK